MSWGLFGRVAGLERYSQGSPRWAPSRTTPVGELSEDGCHLGSLSWHQAGECANGAARDGTGMSIVNSHDRCSVPLWSLTGMLRWMGARRLPLSHLELVCSF